MINHANATPTATATFSRVIEVALPVFFFAAILLFGILGSLRYAHGWVEVLLSEGAAATAPMAIDSLIALVSALVTAVGVVWLYVGTARSLKINPGGAAARFAISGLANVPGRILPDDNGSAVAQPKGP